MDNGGSNIGCPCTLCAGSTGLLPKNPSGSSHHTPSSISSSSRLATPKGPAPLTSHHFPTAPQQSTLPVGQPVKGRPKTANPGYDTTHVDEEGTPDVYRNLIDKLQRHGTIDEKIEEPLSPDWRAESEILPMLLQDLRQKEQWKPRQGEILLFARNLPEDVEIVMDEVTGKYRIYNGNAREFLGTPVWEAGLVGQIPIEGQNTLDNVVNSGVRVEPLPNPNDSDKSLSKHYRYVPLKQTRPFMLWEHFLGKLSQDEWHPTVQNALTVTSTLSLVGKYRFRGTWPNASIYCHAMYLGHELLAVGDTVRLLPSVSSNHGEICDVMVIKSIRIKWSNLDKASNNDYDEGRPYNSTVWLYGTAFTSDVSRSDKQWLSDTVDGEPLKAVAEYSSWYPLHPPSKELAIPHTRCMGRVYEMDAMSVLLGVENDNLLSLDVGRTGLIKARAFSSKHDQRIVKDDATWYWGDNRADSLGLQTINGLDVAKFDQLRDIEDLRKKIKIIEADRKPASSSRQPVTATASSSRELRGFMAPQLPPTPGRNVAIRTLSGSSNVTSSFGSEGGKKAGQKRVRVDSISDEEAEEVDDEFRKSTVVVEDIATKRKKKPMVQVVIDD